MRKTNKTICAVIAALLCTGLGAQDAKQPAVKLYEQGIQAQEDEDWYGASQNFLEAVHANPVYGDAWMHLAQCTYQLGQYDLAMKYLDTAEKYEKGSPAVHDMRGMCCIGLGRISEARKIFNDVLVSYPNDIDARFGLAELELLDGKITGAETQYAEALRRQTTNRKALLSLAVVSLQLGKNDAAQYYMNQALKYYSGEAEVHYMGAVLSSMQGNLAEAERQARTAVEIDGSYDYAYEILASILYSEGKYSDAADVCDFRIGRNRNTPGAWYLRGLSQQKLGNTSDAIASWTTGLSVDPLDEIQRAALELQVNESVSVEDARRKTWAQYHIKNAREYAKRYDSTGESFEYQSALKIDPSNREARRSFAEMLEMNGLHELYVEQLKFIKENGTDDAQKTADASSTQMNDTIEAYDSLLQNTLAKKWNIQPFYLDKIRYHIGIYYEKSAMQMIHADAGRITAEAAAGIFSGAAVTSVSAQASPVTGFGEAYRRAHAAGEDYFVILSIDEGRRDLSLNGKMYAGRTGTKMREFSFYGTGNQRYSNVLRRFRTAVLEKLPIRGKILDRSGKEVVVDTGRSEMIKNGAVFNIVKKGSMRTADTVIGLTYSNTDILGTLTITKTGEEISEGTIEGSGFYDRINTDDEIVLISLPKENTAAASAGGNPAAVVDNAPAANASGKPVAANAVQKKKNVITAEDLGLRRTPAVLDLLRSIY